MKSIHLFILGSIVGSFLAVVSIRLPRGESLLMPPSHCDHCQQTLRPIDLIPLISALHQRFVCRYCHQKFSTRSFWLEFFCGLLFYHFLHDFHWLNLWYLFWLLSSLVLALIDWDQLIVEMRIFLLTGIPLLISAMLLLPLHWLQPIIVGLLFYLSQKILPNSFGLGDLWIIGLWSCFLSSYELLQVLFSASFSGLLFFSYRTLQKKPLIQLPFLPFLFIGLLLLLLKKC